jgi:hypothetical protein
MVKPSIAVEITARDKTETGRRAAERGFGALARKTSGFAKQSGLAGFGKQLEGLSKIRDSGSGFSSIARGMSSISSAASGFSGTFETAATRITAFGAAGEGALSTFAEAGVKAATSFAGLAGSVLAAAGATYMLGDKWAKTGAEIGRTAETLGVSTRELQAARGAAERFGVSTDVTTASLDAFGTTLYKLQTGGDQYAAGVLNELQIGLKKTKAGADDVNQALMDVSDAIARQTDPQKQRAIADAFHVTGMLPALRKGSKVFQQEAADYASSPAALSDAEVARSVDINRKTTALGQHAGAVSPLGARAGMLAEPLTDALASGGLAAAHGLERRASGFAELGSRAVSAFSDSAKSIVHGGLEAGRHLIEGGERAGRMIGDEFQAFQHRIEKQESGGHQFRHGQPLKSRAGAVGAMQVMHETGMRAAARAGIPWDENKFLTDKAYNEKIGTAELYRLYQKYGGDQVLTASAYNAGEGRTDRWIKRYGDPRSGQITDEQFEARIPIAETRDYARNTAKKTEIEITIRGAPAGTSARVSPGDDAAVSTRILGAMEGP